MVSNLDSKCWKIRLGTVFCIFQIDFISEGFVFSFLMLSGRVESMRIARKPCRVSQNRGSAVFHNIHDFSQKLLKMSPPISPKVTENTKYPYPGPSENTPTFQFQFLSFLVSFQGPAKVIVWWSFSGFLESVPQGAPGWSQGPLFASANVIFRWKCTKNDTRNVIY